MASFAYRLGRGWAAIGSVGQVAVVLGAFGAGLAWHANRTVTVTAAAQAASAVELTAWQEAREAQLQAKCVTNVKSLIADAASAIKAGNPGDAATLMFECEDTMTEPQAIALLEAARKAQDAKERKARDELRVAELKFKRSQGVSIGMSAQDALESQWGKPDSVNRTTTARGTSEQWVYGSRRYLYFENGRLTAVQN